MAEFRTEVTTFPELRRTLRAIHACVERLKTGTTASLDDLESALEGNAEFYEGLYSQELLRPSGPRKGALRLFLKFEMGHEDREDRKSEIEAALK